MRFSPCPESRFVVGVHVFVGRLGLWLRLGRGARGVYYYCLPSPLTDLEVGSLEFQIQPRALPEPSYSKSHRNRQIYRPSIMFTNTLSPLPPSLALSYM